MSAFQVSDAHINLLVQAGRGWHASLWDESEQQRVNFRSNEHELAQVLYEANIASLQARYSDPGDMIRPFGGFKYGHAPLDPVTVLKACDCFDYQACEFDNYHDCLAARIVDCVRYEAIRHLPGYEAAPWEYTGVQGVNPGS